MNDTDKLLSRKDFRRTVFRRDHNKCVLCGDSAKDAHHIIERRLFPDGGYYLNNGASLCGDCHIDAEQTVASVEEIRRAAGITKNVIPPHLYSDHRYDKWGNHILPDGTRTKGELFFDENVQKIIPQYIKDLFRDWVKYPRTWHLPISNATKDDRTHKDFSLFEGQEIVITEKMDGENATLYTDYFHARSVDGNSHPSQSWVKGLQAKKGYLIPKNWRVCGENMYAEHSIKYEDLESYFLMFSIWNEKNQCLSWQDTKVWAELLGFKLVPALYEGKFNRKILLDTIESLDTETQEGIVLRLTRPFAYTEFTTCVAKWVRPNHVAETKHNWRMRWDERKINLIKNK